MTLNDLVRLETVIEQKDAALAQLEKRRRILWEHAKEAIAENASLVNEVKRLQALLTETQANAKKNDSVENLEATRRKQMTELTRSYNEKMEALQNENAMLRHVLASVRDTLGRLSTEVGSVVAVK